MICWPLQRPAHSCVCPGSMPAIASCTKTTEQTAASAINDAFFGEKLGLLCVATTFSFGNGGSD